MLFRIAAFSALVASAMAATDEAYNYDEPHLWQDMAGSACAGQKNSPIAVEDDGCTVYADYAMNVS